MFDLDQAIVAWRRRLASEGVKSRAVLDELESHLREDVEQRVQSGANEAEAFQAGVERLGSASALRAEFAKVHERKRASRWTWLRALCAVCAAVCAALIMLISTWSLLALETNALQRSAGLVLVPLIALYLGSLPHWFGSLSAGQRAAVKKALAMANILVYAWTLFLLLAGLKVLQVQIGLGLNMILWSACVAFIATVLADAFPGGDRPAGVPFPALSGLTPMAQRSLEVARGEAAGFYHDFVGTEHVLLGLFNSDQGVVSKVMRNLGLEREEVRREILKLIGLGPEHPAGGALPCTPRARRALELALREARALNQPCAGPEHILLGLLLEGSGVAALVLQSRGVNSKTAREEILKELGN